MPEHPQRRQPRPPRRRRSDGERSRNAILREAAQLATVEGIDGLSIARLADAVGMSKSGLFAHFGSKEELQLATIEAAEALFTAQVTEPASAAASAGERLQQLAENYLRYIQDAFPGGCFFASLTAEIDTHPGPVRDRAVEFMNEWLRLLETTIRAAQQEGAISAAEDAAQLAYELEAYLLLANTLFVATRDAAAVERGRQAIRRRLSAAA